MLGFDFLLVVKMDSVQLTKLLRLEFDRPKFYKVEYDLFRRKQQTLPNVLNLCDVLNLFYALRQDTKKSAATTPLPGRAVPGARPAMETAQYTYKKIR